MLFCLPFASRSSESSTARSGNQSSRTSGASTAVTASSATPATPTTGNTVTTPQAPKKSSSNTTRRSAGPEEETPNAANSGSGGQPKVLLSELQSFLSNLQGGDLAAGGSGAAANRNGGASIDLSTAINSEAVDKIAADAARAQALLAHLPTTESGETAKQQLKDTISSPQFQQALSMFSTALQSGQLGPVVSQFELNSDAVAAANTGDLEQFVKALEKNAEKSADKTAATKKKDEKEKDEETPMEEDKNV